MKLAKVDTKFGTVELHYHENSGYSIEHRCGSLHGCESFIPTKAQAEKALLWSVGYPEWEQASRQAFKKARDQWLAKHLTLASVNVENLTP